MSATAIHARVAADRARIEGQALSKNVPDLLYRAAADVPDAVALSFFEDGLTISYRELAVRVRTLACAFAGIGIRHGTHVGVMLTNTPMFPVTWLALLHLGAVMVPINTRYTSRELDYVLRTSDAVYLVIESGLLPTWQELAPNGRPIAVENVLLTAPASEGADAITRSDGSTMWSALGCGGREGLLEPSPAEQSDLANIQFTSGSTGFPKGCMQTHRFWLEAATVIAKNYLPEAKRILLYQSFFYMDPQFLMLAAICNRGTAYIARGPSTSRYANWVNDHRIEFAFMSEPVFKYLKERGETLPSLRRVNIFGWSKDNHRIAQEFFPFPLREAFGMTEIGMALYQPEEAESMVGEKSCGLEMAFRSCKVVNDEGAEAGADQIGELWVRGEGVIKGYYKNPMANAAGFNGPWFRTGDLFSRDAAGFFYYRGRLKDMIRRSGENIAAQEVESILLGCPFVIEAAVVGVSDESRGEEVKAFVVCREGIDIRQQPEHIDAMIKLCEANLASFKIPRFFQQIEAFPRTGSNKIAKRQLIDSIADLRANSYDRKSMQWI